MDMDKDDAPTQHEIDQEPPSEAKVVHFEEEATITIYSHHRCSLANYKYAN